VVLSIGRPHPGPGPAWSGRRVVERLKQRIENAIRYEPAMTSDERAALERSATALREATSRVLGTGP
jgi:hypothetical protein